MVVYGSIIRIMTWKNCCLGGGPEMLNNWVEYLSLQKGGVGQQAGGGHQVQPEQPHPRPRLLTGEGQGKNLFILFRTIP